MGGSSSKNMNNPYVVGAQARHTATLIFLHGLGDTGEGWSQMFRQLKLKNVKTVCPTAPIIPVTLNAGFRMPSCIQILYSHLENYLAILQDNQGSKERFDIRSLSPDGPEDEPGIKAAVNTLRELIDKEEKNGISSDNIFVGGFSQGGAVALYTALTSEKPLAGIVGLSCWLPLHKEFPQGIKVNRDIPVFQAHGTEDPLVPKQWGEMTGNILKQMTSKHTFKTYNMMHSSCQEEMDDVKSFVNSLAKD